MEKSGQTPQTMFEEINLNRIWDENARELMERLLNLVEKLLADANFKGFADATPFLPFALRRNSRLNK